MEINSVSSLHQLLEYLYPNDTVGPQTSPHNQLGSLDADLFESGGGGLVSWAAMHAFQSSNQIHLIRLSAARGLSGNYACCPYTLTMNELMKKWICKPIPRSQSYAYQTQSLQHIFSWLTKYCSYLRCVCFLYISYIDIKLGHKYLDVMQLFNAGDYSVMQIH